MKKYIKPSFEVVSLKSSVDIAANSYKSIADGMINDYLHSNGKTYTISKYAVTGSGNEAQV